MDTQLTDGALPHVVIIGGGFTGLGAAYELVKKGMRVTVLEAAESIGGLAGSFEIDGFQLEKFYHHWFTSDAEIMRIVEELEVPDHIIVRNSPTGMYYANSLFRLASPIDVLRFTPLRIVDRFRLGLMVFRARSYKNWQELDSIPAEQWLKKIAGPEVFRIVWEPLLHGKFGQYASIVSAAWFWKKIVLRGGSRGKGGKENLAYFRGGFAAFANKISNSIVENGGRILVNTPATGIVVENQRITAVSTSKDLLKCDAVIATPALPIIADLVSGHVSKEYEIKLRAIKYLANVCVVLQLDKSLGSLYWTNVNDPSFPFVGVIEHTNFEPPESYGGRHIIYLSKYLDKSDPYYHMSDQELLDFCLPYVEKMFPEFKRSWIKGFDIWREQYTQPVTECGYQSMIPDVETPIKNLLISTMAQIYPEDRGTNHALRDGRVAGALAADLVNQT